MASSHISLLAITTCSTSHYSQTRIGGMILVSYACLGFSVVSACLGEAKPVCITLWVCLNHITTCDP